MNRELVSPCGLYCGICAIYYATKHDDMKLKEKLARAYNDTVDKISCNGCMSDNVYWYCRHCAIKSCAMEKNYEGCNECGEFPCEKVENFPVPEGKKHILRAVPRWKELGTEEWIKEEEKLFSCKNCSTLIFRGAKKCRSCDTLL
jgi:hypothetical protein